MEAGLRKWPFVAGTESSPNCSSNVSDVLVRNNKFMCYKGPRSHSGKEYDERPAWWSSG